MRFSHALKNAHIDKNKQAQKGEIRLGYPIQELCAEL